jgi:hypothetical protein
MPIRIIAAVVSAAFLAGATGPTHAQGYVTQDPGSHAPRNLTLQDLGPSVTIPTEPADSGIPTLRFPRGRGAGSPMPGYGSSTPSSGSGNPGAYGATLGGNR